MQYVTVTENGESLAEPGGPCDDVLHGEVTVCCHGAEARTMETFCPRPEAAFAVADQLVWPKEHPLAAERHDLQIASLPFG